MAEPSPPLPLGVWFYAWRAWPLPSDPQDLQDYCHEIIDTWVTIDQFGQELQAQLQTTQDDNHIMQEELDQRAQEVLDYQQTIRALTNAMNCLETMTPAEIGLPSRPQELSAPLRFNGNHDDLLS